MKRNNKKGFTIVELVIVIAVIAILAGVLIPTFSGIIRKANESKALQAAKNLYTEVYALDASDGKIDGKEKETSLATSYDGKTITYTVADGKVTTFEYTSGDYTATFTGSTNTWAVAKSGS